MAPRTSRVDPDAAAVDGTEPADAAPRAHRTWGQRVLLGVGIVASMAAIAAAITVGWAAWKYHQIDRADVALDDAGDGPVNYLIVGSDTRSGGDPNDRRAIDDHKPLADTIMILRVDGKERQAKVLSLPRDLWVTVSGTGKQGRINAAYATGGPQRLIDTLQATLQIPINHYVEVDFAGFQKVVTAVGGVPMWFDRAMRDRNSGLDVLHPGCTVLDGYGALGFARARHLEYYDRGTFHYDGTGDLGRISRQQLFIRRLIDRAKAKGIRNPLTLKRLIDAGTESVTLDKGLSVSSLASLGERFSDFRSDSLVSYTLPASPRTTSGGAAVLDLDRTGAQPILDQFRNPEQIQAAASSASSASATTAPGVRLKLWVLNSSGRQGLAVAAADGLGTLGFDVAHWGNGVELQHAAEGHSTVRYGTGASGLAGLVAASVRSGATVVSDPSLPDGRAVLFLGTDFTTIAKAAPTSTTTTTPAASSASTVTATTTPPPPSKVVGMVPGDPPPGRTCG